MKFKQAIINFPLLKTVYEQLIIKTSMGRDKLLSMEFSVDKAYLEQQYALIEDCQNFLSHIKDNDKMLLECILYDIHNIGGSLKLLQQGETLDDIALFEIKAFCLSCKKLNSKLQGIKSKDFVFENLQDIISLLDPEGLEVNQFYIYSSYKEGLKEKRSLFEKYKKEEHPETTKIYNEVLEIENEVRKNLSEEIKKHIKRLQDEVERVALFDISLAKAELNINLNLVKPTLSNEPQTTYYKIFNPIIKQTLNKKGKDFQPIDITIEEKPVLITGANMAGKTVVLKTLALAQLMTQYAFFVPCKTCSISLVEEVLCSIGDNQNENEGLSSFASEILCLNDIIQKVKTKKRYLVLADELARTTNPVEGIKLLNGFISTLSFGNSLSVITTHYSNITADCKRLRVKGFINKNLQAPISIENLADNIDYSLIQDSNTIVPNEALNLCHLLGIDDDWLNNAQNSDK
mgnify:FL=1